MFVQIGKFFVPAERVSSVVSIGSAEGKRLKELGEMEGKLLNLTYGKKARSVIFMDSGHVIITSIDVEELVRLIWEGKP